MDDNQTVLVVQHVACETLGTIEQSLHSRGLTPQFVRVHAGDVIPPSLGNSRGLIVLGGPLSVYESAERPHLVDEMKLIEAALHAERPVLGVCLGAQLLAHVLGAKVYPGARKEIGWHTVTLNEAARHDRLWTTLPAAFPAFHWHGDVFDLPQGAVNLASSELTACQAFRSGMSVYGILFHMEVNETIIGDVAATFPEDLAQGGGDAQRLATESSRQLPALAIAGRKIFDGWAKLVIEN